MTPLAMRKPEAMAARRNLSDVVGLPEAAKFLGVSRQTVWLAIQEGRLIEGGKSLVDE